MTTGRKLPFKQNKMDLQKLKQQHEDSIEILEFLELLERHEQSVMETNLAYKRMFQGYGDSCREHPHHKWNCQVIKRARNYAVNKYNNLNK